MDFEPKKRELYESTTEATEMLSASSDDVKTTKGTTKTKSVEASVSGPLKGITLGAKAGYTKQDIDQTVTDSLREARETKSHSTTFSQMYQLFNGYHLGTNRALFVVAPRPHTASSSELAEFNLIDGPRKLEGIQDVFLVVLLPKKLSGFCVQASIDTGHTVMVTNMLAKDNPTQPNGGEEDGYHPPPPPPPPDETYNELVVTRRIVQNCGTFDDNGNFVVTGISDIKHPDVTVVWEDGVLSSRKISTLLRAGSFDTNVKTKFDLANQMNITQRRIIKSMISGFSAGNFEPIEFTKSKTFRRRVRNSIQDLDIPVSKLVELNYLSKGEATVLLRSRIMTAGDIFKDNLGQSNNPDIRKLRSKILEKVGIRTHRQN